MIHSIAARAVTYAETDRSFALTWEALCNRLQEAAIAHADAVGFGAERCRRDGVAWVLHRLAIEIERLPVLGAALRVATWSTGISGLRGRRDFVVWADGDEVVRASSVWVHFDLAQRAPRRVPSELVAAFAPRPAAPLVAWVERIERRAPEAPELVAELAVRYTDLDANDHVNNAAYADFVQTLAHRAGRTGAPSALGFVFAREIPGHVAAVTGAFASDGAAGARFAIAATAEVNATGIVRWREGERGVGR